MTMSKTGLKMMFGLFYAATLHAAAPAFVWIEGEQAHDAVLSSPKPKWEQGADRVLSGKGCYVLYERNHEPLEHDPHVTYRFDVKQAGMYNIWARIGYEVHRSPFNWSLDNAPVEQVDATVKGLNLTMAEPVDLSWIKLGRRELAGGEHTLSFVVQGREVPKKRGRKSYVFALDAVCLNQGPFQPANNLKPGESYDTPADRDAADKVYRFPDLPTGHAGSRQNLELSGLWQVARYDDPDMDKDTPAPVKTLPDLDALTWMGIEAPGDAIMQRPELYLGHRLLFKTRVQLPSDQQGRGFHLHFSGMNYIVSVFVNGQYAGDHRGVLVPWDLDVTRQIKPGADNEIVLAVKSPWYAMDPKPKGVRETAEGGNDMRRGDLYPHGVHDKRSLPKNANTYYIEPITPSTKGEGDGAATGIVNPVTLTACGKAYVSDVQIITSVKEKEILLRYEVLNPLPTDAILTIKVEAVHEKSGMVDKTFESAKLAIPADQTGTLQLREPWSNPKLWWPAESIDDLPDCYILRTTLLADGLPIDVHNELFGFREVSHDGMDILVNGVPWSFFAWVDPNWQHEPVEKKTPDEWFRRYFKEGNSYHRISHDHDKLFGYREQALAWLDRHGVPGRLSTCIDGMGITHDLTNPDVWKNFERHVRQLVKAYRNHPSIMHYSIENELVYIAARLGMPIENYKEYERKLMDIFEKAEELDPTRESMGDGAGDLGGLAKVNCQHYTWSIYKNWPYHFYHPIVNKPCEDRAKRWGNGTDLYVWTHKNPLIGGEEFFWTGSAAFVAGFGGPAVYESREQINRAAVRLLRMGIEGHRWADVAGAHFWTHWKPGMETSLKRKAVFCKEHDQAFYPGALLKRRIAIFNDSRTSEPLTFNWALVFDGRTVQSGRKTVQVKPGYKHEDTLEIPLPEATVRTNGALALTLNVDGREVFRDEKPVHLLPHTLPAKTFGKTALCVWDPRGTTAARLDALGYSFTVLKAPLIIPEGCEALLIGSEALSADNRTAIGQTLTPFVEAGGMAIVLDQTWPLEEPQLPIKDFKLPINDKTRNAPEKVLAYLEKGGARFPFAYPVANNHPIFAGLEKDDFFTWNDSVYEPIYRCAYPAGVQVGTVLMVGGGNLDQAPIVELTLGKGALLLCQMDLRAYLGRNPVADRLLCNAVAWAHTRRNRVLLPTCTAGAMDDLLTGFLRDAGVEMEHQAELVSAISGNAAIVIAEASPAHLELLLKHRSQLKAFCEKGGWLMLSRLAPRALEPFDRLTGIKHRMRPFRFEGVKLANRDDPLLLSLSPVDITQYGDSKIKAWMPGGTYQVSDGVFTHVVDTGTDIASFVIDGYGSVTNSNNGKVDALVDNMTSAEHWIYTCYFNADGNDRMSFTLDRPETLSSLTIHSSDAYYLPREVEVIFNNAPETRRTIVVPPEVGKTDLGFDPFKADKVQFRFAGHYPKSGVNHPLVTIDEIELHRVLPEGQAEKCIPLTKPAGLVKYPIGRGGIVLNQLRLDEPDRSYADISTGSRLWQEKNVLPKQNMAKKHKIMLTLLRNMGAAL